MRTSLFAALVHRTHPTECLHSDGDRLTLLLHTDDPDLDRPNVGVVREPVQELVVVYERIMIQDS